MKRTLIIGSIGGLFLYIIETASSLLLRAKLSTDVFGILVRIIMICAVLIAIFTMTFKTSSFVQMLLRFLVFITSYTCIMLINAYIGTRRFIEEVLFYSSSSIDNASGMQSLILLSIVIIASIITIIVFGITKLIKACTK